MQQFDPTAPAWRAIFPARLTAAVQDKTTGENLYSWTEQIQDVDGTYTDAEPARRGDAESDPRQNPARELNNASVTIPADEADQPIVWMRVRGVRGTGDVVYEFSAGLDIGTAIGTAIKVVRVDGGPFTWENYRYYTGTILKLDPTADGGAWVTDYEQPAMVAITQTPHNDTADTGTAGSDDDIALNIRGLTVSVWRNKKPTTIGGYDHYTTDQYWPAVLVDSRFKRFRYLQFEPLHGVTPTSIGTVIQASLDFPDYFQINFHPASATESGYVTTGTQTIAGNKTIDGSLGVVQNISATDEIVSGSYIQAVGELVTDSGIIRMDGLLVGSSGKTRIDYGITAARTFTFTDAFDVFCGSLNNAVGIIAPQKYSVIQGATTYDGKTVVINYQKPGGGGTGKLTFTGGILTSYT